MGVNVYEDDSFCRANSPMKNQGWTHAVSMSSSSSIDGKASMVIFDTADQTSKLNEFATCLLTVEGIRTKNIHGPEVFPVRGACVFVASMNEESADLYLDQMPLCVLLAYAAAAFQDAKSMLKSHQSKLPEPFFNQYFQRNGINSFL